VTAASPVPVISTCSPPCRLALWWGLIDAIVTMAARYASLVLRTPERGEVGAIWLTRRPEGQRRVRIRERPA